MTTILTRKPNLRDDMREQVNGHAPPWHRVGCLARLYANAETGHAPMREGQVARELGLTVKQVSNAIARARREKWLDPSSTARCLVLPDHALNPCEERHA